mmetsp:Transcript_30789/g.63726  ORF Transcript_30789/g.63726 Transcript_30789/m.63726 type:complete len:214 (-) Transcript_30789:197-838(-)
MLAVHSGIVGIFTEIANRASMLASRSTISRVFREEIGPLSNCRPAGQRSHPAAAGMGWETQAAQVVQVVFEDEVDHTPIRDTNKAPITGVMPRSRMLGPGRESSSGSPSLVTVGIAIRMFGHRTELPENPRTSVGNRDSSRTRWGSAHHIHSHSTNQHPRNEVSHLGGASFPSWSNFFRPDPCSSPISAVCALASGAGSDPAAMPASRRLDLR